MHINMKYYIVTIGAIFIALGIGILVGFNLNYDQELGKQQADIIKDLDTKFEGLKTTNDDLEKTLAAVNVEHDKAIEYINQNLDKLIVDELNEKNIGIISTNENNDYSKDIEDTIVKANGSVAFDIVLKNSVYDETKLKEVSEKLNMEIKTTDDLLGYIIESLKGEDASEKLTYLQELGILKINTLNNNYISYDSVVLAGGNDPKVGQEQFDKIDKVLLPKLKEENKYVIGVQKYDTKFSYVDLYAQDKVTTVDNIDDNLGKLSLVISLKEGRIGEKFGRAEGADSLLPFKK